MQSLVRLRNMIHCDPETYTPIDPHNPNYSGSFWAEVHGITLHLHGGGEWACSQAMM